MSGTVISFPVRRWLPIFLISVVTVGESLALEVNGHCLSCKQIAKMLSADQVVGKMSAGQMLGLVGLSLQQATGVMTPHTNEVTNGI